jgi:acetyl coenzyme A synthetase (ADP forming)-like protein
MLDRYETDVVLSDGGTVRVRPIRPDDRERLVTFFNGLSRETVYYRFFSPKHSLSEREITYFTVVDYVDRFALVALLDHEFVGVARYDRLSPGDIAEVAFVVDDDQQGRGLGSVLLEHLAQAGHDASIARFTASVLPDNARMLRVFRDAGWKVTRRFEDGVIQVEFPIAHTADTLAIMDARERWAEARSIERILAPDSVAVIGASDRLGTVGHAVFTNITTGGFAGPIYPVNLDAELIGGRTAYPHVGDIEGTVDLAVIAVPAAAVPGVVAECADKDVKGVVVLSAGFGEVSAEGSALEALTLETVRDHGMRMVGPNGIGVLNTAVGLNATFVPGRPVPGRVAFQSQSGGLGIALIDWSNQLELGISSFVSVGNKADISGNDLIQYWEQDEDTDVILMYLESFGNPRKFARIARRVSQIKPIVAVKSGRSTAGSRAAALHTAATATSDVVVSALFRQAGVTRVNTLEELLDTAHVFASQPLPQGNRVAIVGNSGGPGVLAADACEGAGLEVARLSAHTASHLRSMLGPNAAVANPIDMVAAATPDQYESVLRLVLEDTQIDSVIVIYTPPMVNAPEPVAEAIARAVAGSPKPVVANFLASRRAPIELLGRDGGRRIPSFPSPEPAAMALGRLTEYAAWRRRDPGAVPEVDGIDREAARAVVEEAIARAADDEPVALSPERTAKLLEAYGISVAATPDDALVAAGTTTVEVVAGVVQDPAFGPLVMFGIGDIPTELVADRAFRILPLTDRDAAELVRSLQGSPLLFGYRGTPATRTDLVEDLLQRVAALADDLPEVVELDLNPIQVSPTGVHTVAATASVRSVTPGRPTLIRSLD